MSLFDTGEISCMSKACLDKPQPKAKLVETKTWRLNSAEGNSLGQIGMTTCILEFPMKFQQQFIICENLLLPVILGLDLSYNYLIGIDWFSLKQ